MHKSLTDHVLVTLCYRIMTNMTTLLINHCVSEGRVNMKETNIFLYKDIMYMFIMCMFL